jgi:hypothetical protein
VRTSDMPSGKLAGAMIKAAQTDPHAYLLGR